MDALGQVRETAMNPRADFSKERDVVGQQKNAHGDEDPSLQEGDKALNNTDQDA